MSRIVMQLLPDHILYTLDEWWQGASVMGSNRHGVVQAHQIRRNFRTDQIHLIQHRQPWNVIHIQLTQDFLHGVHMIVHVGTAHIDHMEQQIRIMQFIQCRLEGSNEIWRTC
jgi:hypothetical protein